MQTDTIPVHPSDPWFPKISDRKLLNIVTFPDPVLKKKAVPVDSFDSNLESFCLDMLRTMYQAPGIGLAAPQVKVSKRVLVMDVDFKREDVTDSEGDSFKRLVNLNPYIFVNPTIEEKVGTTVCQEGCLSLPGIFEDIERAEKIKIKYFTPLGEEKTAEFEGMHSVCFQHELDHLDGIVFLDYLSPLKKEFFLKKLLKQKRRRGK